MEVREIKNKKGETLTTKEGKNLEELRLEVGDEFIPLYNSVLENTNEVDYKDSKGKTEKKSITNYTIKCKARDNNGQIVKHNKTDEIFVVLTPTQAKSLTKKKEEGIELNQNLFVAYEYESKNYGKQIGVGLKKANKPAKSFEDFETDEEDINQQIEE